MGEFEQLIRDLYGKYSPETNVDEKIQKFSQAGLSPQEFLDGFYKKYDPTRGTDDRKNNIIKTYFAKQLKEAEDKELKSKGQYREEDLTTNELNKLQAVDMTKGFFATTLQMADNLIIESGVAVKNTLGRFAKQVDILMETGELRRLTGDEKKEAHLMADIAVSSAPIGPSGLVSRKFQDSSQEFIDELGLDKVVYNQTLSESIKDSESETVSDKFDNFRRLGGRAVASGVESLPYTIASMSGYGIAALTVGAASSKLNEEMERNPDINSEILFLNAVGHGGIEMADALATRYLLGGASKIVGKGGGEKAVKSFFEGGARRFLGYSGAVVGEGLTEMSQAVANDLWDGFTLGMMGDDKTQLEKMDFDSNYWRKKQWEVYDEGIIGSLTGGGFTVYNAARDSDAKRYERMVSMLTPLSVKQAHNENIKKLTELKKKLDNTTDPNSRKIIKDGMKVLKNKITKSSSQSRQVVENLNESQLKEYAKNVDKRNRNLNKIDNKTTPEAKAIIEEQNKELSDINEKMFNEVKEANFGENVRFAKTEGAKLGLNVNVANSKKSFDDKVKALTGQNIKNESGIEGVFIGGGQILINKETALKQGAISVGSHEVLHPVLNALVGNEAKQKKIVQEFKKELTSKQRKYMDKAMKGKTASEQNTEYLTVFSDGLRLKKMDYSLTNAESFMKLGKGILNAFKDVGFTNASFKDGKGVYEFMKEYNKSIGQGGLTDAASKAIKDAEANSKVKIKDVKAVGDMQKSQVYQTVEGMKESLLDPKTKKDTAFMIANELLNEADRRLKINADELTREDIVRNFAFDPDNPRGLQALLKNYSQEKNNSIMGYLNSKVQGGRSLFDLRLQEFYEKDPKYNNILQSLSDEAVQKKAQKKLNEESNKNQGPAARALTDFNDLMINDENFITSDIYKSIKGKIINNITLLLSKGNLDVNSMVDIINKEISNVIKKAQGKISRVDGKVVISEEYDNFVRDGYEGGIKSLPIRVIKDSYLNKLFPSKKLGKVDMQNRKADNPNLRKNSNYRIDKLEIKPPTLGKWIKYFTEGGYTTLLAKQKKYGTEIAKAVSLKATRESLQDADVIKDIVDKSSLRNEEITTDIVKGVLQTLETTLDTKASEAAMFDNIQFSREIIEDVLNSKDPDASLSNVEDPVLRQWIFETFIQPGITSENIAFIGEAFNLIKNKTFSRIGNIRRKIAGKTIVNDEVLKTMELGLDKYVKGIPAQLIKVIGIDFAGLHYRGINWNAKKRDAYISKLKEFEETGDAKKLYDKINIEHLNKQVQGEKQYKEIVLKAMAEPNLEKALQIIKDARTEIKLTNDANIALLNYLTFKAQELNLDPGYFFEVSQMQTNIQNGTRAYSQLGHIYITKGKQIATNKNGNILAKPKNKAGLKGYYEAWSKTSLWDQALEIAKQEKAKDIKKRAVQLLTPKNEHLGASALSNAKAAGGVISKNLTLQNIDNVWSDHITLWAPLMIADMMDKAGGKVNRSGERRIMLLPSEIRKDIINTIEGKPSQDVIIQKEYEAIQFSKSNSDQFNEILEQTKGVDSVKRFSDAAAKSRGAKKGLYDWFIPPSAEDFSGLLYKFLGKGKIGDKQMKFFKEKLMNPFASAMAEIDRRKQQMSNEYLALQKKMSGVKKILGENTGYNEFTYDSAVRVYLWDKAGFEIPGLSKRDQTELVKKIKENADLKLYADSLSAISKLKDGWVKPSESWLGGNIPTDISDINQKVNRKEVLAEWVKNKNEIFSKENLNKIEAIYGTDFRESLEEILGRMERGSNRPIGSSQNKLTTKFMNWVNNSVGAIMFFNARSAILQTISAANFINFKDNNIFAAAGAFANQKQFWSDFTMLFNSDFLKQRRSGLKTDINEAEISNAVGTAPNKATAAFKYMLKKGFLPTQIADSFAIAMGGASFIRNRINSLVKSGMTKKEAMDQAMLDFREISEEAQQSSRPDRISSQQAGPLGRVILAFANTPMQYARMQKKAILDLKNGRGDWKTNMSKILYYGVVQNFIFNALQQALFAMAFDDDEERLDEKQLGIMNGMADSLLRGTGVAGAGVATVKNMVMELIRQNQKDRPDYVNVALKSTSISPPISSKLSKLISAARTFQWNGKEIREEGLSLDNPANLAVGKTVSAFTNIPLDRLIQKVDNLKTATEEETAAWQSIALTLGWDQWSLGLNPYQKKNKNKTKLKKGQVKLRNKSVKLNKGKVKLRK